MNFIEVTPRDAPGEKVYVNFDQVQVVMPNDMNDFEGSILIFDVRGFDKGADGDGSPLCMLILDNYDDLMERLVGYV